MVNMSLLPHQRASQVFSFLFKYMHIVELYITFLSFNLICTIQGLLRIKYVLTVVSMIINCITAKQRVINVLDYGATGNGKIYDTSVSFRYTKINFNLHNQNIY